MRIRHCQVMARLPARGPRWSGDCPDPSSASACAMNRTVGRLLVLCVGILIALGAFGVARLAGASCSPFTRAPCVRVLFLGNSYTYVNDLPAVFRDIARAGGQNVETAWSRTGAKRWRTTPPRRHR